MHTLVDVTLNETHSFESVEELGGVLNEMFQRDSEFYNETDDQHSRDLVEIYRNHDFKNAKIRGRALENMLGIKIT